MMTPAAATTAHQRWATKVPSRTRNSPTKPFSPGRPMEDSITTVKMPANTGATFCDALQLGDLVGVAAVVEEAEQDEQGTGDDAVVDHLEHGALDALGVEGEQAQDREAHVGDRRVGDQPLQVLLHGGDDAAVDDADGPEREHDRREPHGGLGEQVEAEAQEAVGAQLEQDAGEVDRAGGGRLGVGVGEPGVERERRAPSPRRPRRSRGTASAPVFWPRLSLAMILVRSKLTPPPSPAPGQHGQGHDGHQHERRADHRVEEELGGGVDPAAVAPLADEEVQRDQGDLEHQEEQEQVEATGRRPCTRPRAAVIQA